MHINKKIKLALIINGSMLIGILLIIILWYYKPVPIQKEIDTMQYQNNNVAYQEPISLQVIGKYHRRLFKKDYFEGKIQINGYPFTSGLGWDLSPISFDEGYGHIVYAFYEPGSYDERSKMDILRLGFMVCAPNFEQFAIVFYDEKVDPTDEYHPTGWTIENGLFISYPITNREEAISLLNTLFEQNERLSRYRKWH